jgi:hypothetical protein
LPRHLPLLCALLLLTACGHRAPPTGLERAKEQLSGGYPYGAFRDAANELSGPRRQQALEFLAANRAVLSPEVKTTMLWKLRNQAGYFDGEYATDLRPAIDNGLLSSADVAELDGVAAEKRAAANKRFETTTAQSAPIATPRPVHLVIEPTDPAIAEAIKKEMAELDRRVRFVAAADKNAVDITVKRVRWQGSQPPEQSDLIEFPWSAAKLRESGTILIDVRKNIAELQFGFAVVGFQNGKHLASKAVHDTYTEEFHVCSNRRFRNVFGVYGPVPRGPFGLYDFDGYPSEAIRAYCNRNGNTPRLSDLETRAYHTLAGAIRDIAVP